MTLLRGWKIRSIALVAVLIIITAHLYAQEPVNPNASPEARTLLKYLYDIKGKGILTGNHNVQDDPRAWDVKLKLKNGWVEPAIYGNDFRYGSHVKYRQRWINEAISQWKEDGKIITIMYHQARPMDDEASASFSESVQGEVSYAEFEGMLTSNHELNSAWKERMDDVAGYLQQLEDENIPVLFRPYHEMNGGWFWWGNKKYNSQFKRLYRMTYDYLTNEKKLDNILWVLNFDDYNNDFAPYYPGDNYVDILATDVYNAKFSKSHYNALKNLANGRPIAIGEVGEMISMERMKSEFPDYVWFMGWRGLFVDDNTTDLLERIFADDWAINEYEPEITGTGSIRKAGEDVFKVFPNPCSTNGFNFFRKTVTHPGRVSICDSQGNVIFDKKLEAMESSKSLKMPLSPGLYVVRYTNNDRIYQEKLVVQE